MLPSKTSIMAFAAAIAIAQTSEAKTNKGGTQAQDYDPGSRGAFSGIGVESRDIDAIADRIMRDFMSLPQFVNSPVPPRIVIDSEGLSNESMQRINRNSITDMLRASLNRVAAGRVRFVSRESMALVMRERELKRSGIADVATRGMTEGVAGIDYQLVGRISSLDTRDGKSGLVQRRTQIIFELVDLETGDLPWTSEPFVILRAAGDDVVYR